MDSSKPPPGRAPGEPGLLTRLGSNGNGTEPDAARPPRPAYPWTTRLLVPGLLLVAFAALLAYTARGTFVPAADVQVVPVVVRSVPGRATAVPGTPDASASGGAAVAQASGWVEPDPYPVVVNALAEGVVREILVLEGDAVEEGQPVARLISDDAALALGRAEATLRRAQAQLDAARTRWENPVDRQEAVATAEARVAETQAKLEKLKSDIDVAAAQFDEAEILFQQIDATRRRDASSEVEYVTARQRMTARRAALAAARAQQPVLEAQLQGHRAELAASGEKARLRIEEVAALATAEADLAQAEAARDEAALRLERMTVRAPMAGVVLSRHVDAGSKVMLGMDDPLSAAIVRLFNPEELQVRVDVPLAEVAKVGVGMPAEVVVSVLPDRTFAGRVTRVVHEADVTRNTLQVKVSIDNPDANLKPEMLARVKFLEPPASEGDGEVEGMHQAVFAPASLITNEGDATSVWVVDPAQGVARLRAITLGGSREDGWIEVAEGLMPGDRLVADPVGLEDGSRVRVVGEADVDTEPGGSNGVR